MGYLDTRKASRSDTNNFILYYLLDENGKIYSEGMGKTLNISDGGLLMVTGIIVESEHILIAASDERDNNIEIKGKVCYSKKVKKGTIYTGIEFIGDAKEKAYFVQHLKEAYRMTQDISSLKVLISDIYTESGLKEYLKSRDR